MFEAGLFIRAVTAPSEGETNIPSEILTFPPRLIESSQETESVHLKWAAPACSFSARHVCVLIWTSCGFPSLCSSRSNASSSEHRKTQTFRKWAASCQGQRGRHSNSQCYDISETQNEGGPHFFHLCQVNEFLTSIRLLPPASSPSRRFVLVVLVVDAQQLHDVLQRKLNLIAV